MGVGVPAGSATPQLSCLETDHVGTPRIAIDANTQATQWKWDLLTSAFGDHAATSLVSGFALNLRYPGQYYDAETGLHYNYFRDYDPKIGRYLEGDLIGLGGGLAVYGYAFARPLLLVDMRGLATWTCRASSSGGVPIVDYQSSKSPACTYFCFSECYGDSSVIASPNEFSDGFQCAGAELRTQPAGAFVSRHAIGVIDFEVESTGFFTWPIVNGFNAYPSDLVDGLREREANGRNEEK